MLFCERFPAIVIWLRSLSTDYDFNVITGLQISDDMYQILTSSSGLLSSDLKRKYRVFEAMGDAEITACLSRLIAMNTNRDVQFFQELRSLCTSASYQSGVFVKSTFFQYVKFASGVNPATSKAGANALEVWIAFLSLVVTNKELICICLALDMFQGLQIDLLKNDVYFHYSVGNVGESVSPLSNVVGSLCDDVAQMRIVTDEIGQEAPAVNLLTKPCSGGVSLQAVSDDSSLRPHALRDWMSNKEAFARVKSRSLHLHRAQGVLGSYPSGSLTDTDFNRVDDVDFVARVTAVAATIGVYVANAKLASAGVTLAEVELWWQSADVNKRLWMLSNKKYIKHEIEPSLLQRLADVRCPFHD